MRADGSHKMYATTLLFKNEIVADIINKYVQQCITATTGSIPERLQSIYFLNGG